MEKEFFFKKIINLIINLNDNNLNELETMKINHMN